MNTQFLRRAVLTVSLVIMIPVISQGRSFTLDESYVTNQVGGTQSDMLGDQVTSGGDLNGDGYDDVILSAPYNNTGNFKGGAVYILYGSATGIDDTSLTSTTAVMLVGEYKNSKAGDVVAFVGDLNGDGYDEAAVYERHGTSSLQDEGMVYILYGQATAFTSGSALSDVAGSILTGAEAYDRLGRSMAGAGDVNGDGYDDLLLGCDCDQTVDDDQGGAYLFYGGSSMLTSGTVTSTTAIQFTGETDENIGRAVAGGGDVNGDGYDDMVVGGGNSETTGVLYIVYGKATPLTSAPISSLAGTRLDGEAVYDSAGWSAISSAGDINNDGYADIVIGANAADTVSSNEGAAYLVYGQATTLTATALSDSSIVKFSGRTTEGELGESISVGDINNDGYDDILIGEYNTGAYVIKGTSAKLTSMTVNNASSIEFLSPRTNDGIGAAVAMGDIDKDANSELIIAAPSSDYDSTITSSGMAYIVDSGNFMATWSKLKDGMMTKIPDGFEWTRDPKFVKKY